MEASLDSEAYEWSRGCRLDKQEVVCAVGAAVAVCVSEVARASDVVLLLLLESCWLACRFARSLAEWDIWLICPEIWCRRLLIWRNVSWKLCRERREG